MPIQYCQRVKVEGEIKALSEEARSEDGKAFSYEDEICGEPSELLHEAYTSFNKIKNNCTHMVHPLLLNCSKVTELNKPFIRVVKPK